MGYYLLKKIINETNLKYLCKRIDTADPIKYKGSGTLWRRILNKHPEYTVTTEILGHYNTKEKLIAAGLYYSKLWNIVESKEWANIIPEIGDGGPTVKGKRRYYNKNTLKGKFFNIDEEVTNDWIRGAIREPFTKEHIEKIRSFHIGRKRSEETKANMRNSIRKPRLKIKCKLCDREITKQNMERHLEKTHAIQINQNI